LYLVYFNFSKSLHGFVFDRLLYGYGRTFYLLCFVLLYHALLILIIIIVKVTIIVNMSIALLAACIYDHLFLIKSIYI